MELNKLLAEGILQAFSKEGNPITNTVKFMLKDKLIMLNVILEGLNSEDFNLEPFKEKFVEVIRQTEEELNDLNT